MTDRVKDVMALAGAACLVAAAYLVHPIAGLAVAGLVLIAVSFLTAYFGGNS